MGLSPPRTLKNRRSLGIATEGVCAQNPRIFAGKFGRFYKSTGTPRIIWRGWTVGNFRTSIRISRNRGLVAKRTSVWLVEEIDDVSERVSLIATSAVGCLALAEELTEMASRIREADKNEHFPPAVLPRNISEDAMQAIFRREARARCQRSAREDKNNG